MRANRNLVLLALVVLGSLPTLVGCGGSSSGPSGAGGGAGDAGVGGSSGSGGADAGAVKDTGPRDAKDAAVEKALCMMDPTGTPCERCGSTNCCAELNACYADSSCTAADGVMDGCTDTASEGTCLTAFGASGPVAKARTTCLSVHCKTECGLVDASDAAADSSDSSRDASLDVALDTATSDSASDTVGDAPADASGQ
jgi:hypothetical protein